MDLIVDFCYSVPVVSRLTVENIGHVMCAADFLRMTAVTAQCTKKLTKLTEASVVSVVMYGTARTETGHAYCGREHVAVRSRTISNTERSSELSLLHWRSRQDCDLSTTWR